MNTPQVYPYRRTLIVILGVIGLNAVFAGYGFIGTPDGSAVGIPHAWLAETPFKDYAIPGAVLFGLGVLHLCGAYFQWRRDPIGAGVAEASGLGLLIWIAVQAALMGSFRHPAQTTLQGICLLAAIATMYLAARQNKFRSRSQPSSDLPVRS